MTSKLKFKEGCRITSKEIKLGEGFHKVTPAFAINKHNSRFAYKLKAGGKPINGLWVLDSVDVNLKAFIYKKVNC